MSGARGARWQSLLRPIKAIPYRRVLGYTYVGYLANNVLPARLGELVRSHALGEGEALSRTTVLGTVVVERIVDTLFVRRVGRPVGGRAERPWRDVERGAPGGGRSSAARGRAWSSGSRSHRLPGADRVDTLRRSLAARDRAGAPTARGPRGGGQARHGRGGAGLERVAWGASIATFLAAGQAVGIELTLAQGALLSSGVALATIVPSGPGVPRHVRADGGGDRDDVRHRARRGVRDGPPRPRDDPGRHVGGRCRGGDPAPRWPRDGRRRRGGVEGAVGGRDRGRTAARLCGSPARVSPTSPSSRAVSVRRPRPGDPDRGAAPSARCG